MFFHYFEYLTPKTLFIFAPIILHSWYHSWPFMTCKDTQGEACLLEWFWFVCLLSKPSARHSALGYNYGSRWTYMRSISASKTTVILASENLSEQKQHSRLRIQNAESSKLGPMSYKSYALLHSCRGNLWGQINTMPITEQGKQILKLTYAFASHGYEWGCACVCVQRVSSPEALELQTWIISVMN